MSRRGYRSAAVSLVVIGAACDRASIPDPERPAKAPAVTVEIDAGRGVRRAHAREHEPDSGAPGLPASLAGTYHLSGKVDAVNLVLEEDGRAWWSIDGCDFSGGDCARARTTSAGLVIESAGSEPLQWDFGGSFAARPDSVVVEDASDPATLVIRVTRGREMESQRWVRGAICPKCAGEGPESLHACRAPRITPACR